MFITSQYWSCGLIMVLHVFVPQAVLSPAQQLLFGAGEPHGRAVRAVSHLDRLRHSCPEKRYVGFSHTI